MKKIFYFTNVTALGLSLLFFSCNQRNTTEVEQTLIPQGERLFSPKWELTKDLDGYEVTKLELSFNSYIIAATSSGNLFRSKSNGDNWILAPAGNNAITVIHRSIKTIMYAGTVPGELYYSNTNGRTWNLLRNFNDRINAIITANDSSLIVGTASGLYRSEDNTETWNLVSKGISSNQRIYSLIVLSDGNILAGSNEGLYLSIDNGISWSPSGFNEICYNFAQSYNSALFAGTQNGVFRSENKGKSWIQIGLVNEKILSLSVTNEIHVFAGTNGKGIFYSHNNGYNWTNFGLDNKTISTILDVRHLDMVFAGCGNKIYRISANQ